MVAKRLPQPVRLDRAELPRQQLVDSASKNQIFGPSGVANNETRCPTHGNTEVNGSSQWPKALEIMAAAGPRPVDHKGPEFMLKTNDFQPTHW